MKKFTLIFISLLCLGLISLSAQDVTYTDNFEENHDYLTQGVEGTIWQGYKVNSSIGTADPPINDTEVLQFKAVDGGLLIESNMGDFEHNQDDGAYIYRVIPGGIDFEAQVKITNGHFFSFQDSVSYYNSAGLVLRNPDTAVANYLYFHFFEVSGWNIHSILKSTVDGTQTELLATVTDFPSLTQYPFMKLSRVGTTFSASLSPDGFTWTVAQTVERTDFAGLDLQIGLTQCNFWSEVAHTAVLDNFKLTHAEVAYSGPENEMDLLRAYAFNGRIIVESTGNGMINNSKVYSIDGREIASLDNVMDRRVEFDNLTTGLYIAVVNIDGTQVARKVVVQ
ncbi:MAG: hypothetical protein JXR52_06415 [Bacteroidales bacterium]|nr:hypothetical protein [Bacteroidales bacterium]